jgi:chemotaxis protein histidine kinase CheA
MADGPQESGLAWTRAELLALIERAEELVLDAQAGFEEAPLGPQKALAEAVPVLHQIVGVLKLLGLDQATALVEELERLALALISGRVPDMRGGHRVLVDALRELPGCLDPAPVRQTEALALLLPVMNAARALRGETPVVAWRESDLTTRVSGSTASRSFLDRGGIERLRRIRGVYQQALLLALREGAPLEALAALREAARQVQALCAGGVQARLWETFCLYVDALAAQLSKQPPKAASRLDPDSIRVLRRMDAELRMLCDAGAAVPDLPPAREHLRELLSATERLGGRVPLPLLESQERRAEEAAFVLSTREARTAAAAVLAQELSRARDLLHRSSAASRLEVGSDVESVLALLRGLASTLSMLGLESSRATVLNQIDELKRSFLDPSAWATARDALALVAGNLDRLGLEAADEAPEPPDAEWALRILALRDRFPAIEQAVVVWAGSGWSVDLLQEIANDLAALAQALREAALDSAADILALLAERVAPRYLAGEAPDFTVLNDIAGAIAGTEYHVEQRAAGNPGLARDALTFALESLERLEPGARLRTPPPAVSARVAPAVDPEVVLAFHEEAQALLKAMGVAARRVRGETPGTALNDLRRLLHTLKGGARLVALSDLADQAHDIETWLAAPRSTEQSAAIDGHELAQRLETLAAMLGLPRELLDPPELKLPETTTESAVVAAVARDAEPTAVHAVQDADLPLPHGAPPRFVQSAELSETTKADPAAAQTAEDLVRVRRGLLGEVTALAVESGVLQSRIAGLIDALGQDTGGDHDPSGAFESKFKDLQALLLRWERAHGQLQDRVKRAPMLPCSWLQSRLQATVLSVANALGKSVEFATEGAGRLVDGELLQQLAAPLEHLLRNAVDHGIEPAQDRVERGKPVAGHVGVAFRRRGAELVIDVTDDGRGLDLEQVRARADELGLLVPADGVQAQSLEALIFEPGFSTASSVTQISGRGIGLDAAREALAQLGGTLTCSSDAGRGCRFRIALPAVMVLDRVLIVRAGAERYAVPLDSIEAVLRGSARLAIEAAGGERRLEYRGLSYPLRSLADCLEGLRPVGHGEAPQAVLLISDGVRRLAVEVDAVEVEQLESGRELLAMPPVSQLRGLPWLAGAAVLGQDEVILVLHLPGLLEDAAAADREHHDANTGGMA